MSLEEKIEQEKPGFFKKWGKRLLKFGVYSGVAISIFIAGGVFGKLSGTMVRYKDTNIVCPFDFKAQVTERRDLTIANEKLLDFPDEIPGTEFVDKYLTPGAKHCLVHIRQVHLNPDKLLNDTEEILNYVENTQTDIYNTLSYLVENNELKEVYTEGVGKSNDEYGEEVYQEYSSLQNIVQNKDEIMKKLGLDYYNLSHLLENYVIIEGINRELFSLPSLLYKIEIAFSIVVLRKMKVIEFYKVRTTTKTDLNEFNEKLKYGACEKLAAEGKIKLIGIEDEYAVAMREYYRTKLVSNKEHYLSYFEPVEECDNRENVILAKIAQREDTLAVLVLGAYHAFGGEHSFGEPYNYDERPKYLDNIAVWNMMHPDKKFSLIEIFPENLNYEERIKNIPYEQLTN